MSAPTTYAEWRAETYGEPLPEPKPRKPWVLTPARLASARANTRSGRRRKPRPVREGHVPGGSRWCYAQGCGHDDCYAREANYHAERHGQPPRTEPPPPP